mmetsp:Transcript_111678/g.320861  ORF Transcript_111678/g.320861 Transcript_111678/m.320861 type:complete len:236 (+) Transcript_111678:1050-1757(+)
MTDGALHGALRQGQVVRPLDAEHVAAAGEEPSLVNAVRVHTHEVGLLGRQVVDGGPSDYPCAKQHGEDRRKNDAEHEDGRSDDGDDPDKEVAAEQGNDGNHQERLPPRPNVQDGDLNGMDGAVQDTRQILHQRRLVRRAVHVPSKRNRGVVRAVHLLLRVHVEAFVRRFVAVRALVHTDRFVDFQLLVDALQILERRLKLLCAFVQPRGQRIVHPFVQVLVLTRLFGRQPPPHQI